MERRAELHFHLLPGVDDGPVTMDEAVALARLAVTDGTSTVVATPHVCDIVPEELPERVEEVARRLRESRIDLDVRCGGEIAYGDVPGLSRRDLKIMASGPAGGEWVLLEAPLPETGASARDLRDAAGAIRSEGFGVLLGHPERSPLLFEDEMAALRAELEAGSVPQINATSLLGVHGEAERERALALARACSRTVVASDAHRPSRGPALTPAIRSLVAAGVPRRMAAAMTGSRPRALLELGLSPLRPVRAPALP